MIVLDTNVISEAIRMDASEIVLGWMTEHGEELTTTAVTKAEMYHGVALLPAGRRKETLRAAIDRIFSERFKNVTLDFSGDAALIYADIMLARRRSGRPISTFDAMIAAIARLHGATLATRDTEDFAGCGIEVVNPWLG